MKFWSKNKDTDKESARKIPQEQQSATQESTLVTVPTEEDYDVIDDKNLNESVTAEKITPVKDQLDIKETEKEEQELRSRLEQIENDKLRKQKEQDLIDLQSETENVDPEYSSQHLIYLTDAECLREILKKIDYLILEINELKTK